MKMHFKEKVPLKRKIAKKVRKLSNQVSGSEKRREEKRKPVNQVSNSGKKSKSKRKNQKAKSRENLLD
jgi:hypothetical protein